MTTGNETDPRDNTLAKAWRAQSQDAPPSALDATILAAAHRAVGSGPRDARKQALEATRPQRWWMPLAAAATIGVVVIGILQIAPQAPVDIVVGERAEVEGRLAPATPVATAKDAAQGNVVAQLKEVAPTKSVEQPSAGAPTTKLPSTGAAEQAKKAALGAATAPPPLAPAATAPATLADARKQVAAAPSMPAPEPFPADKLSRKSDAGVAQRQNEHKDIAEPQSALAPFNEAATRDDAKVPPASPSAPARLESPAPLAAPAPMVAQAPAPAMMAPAPMKKESTAGASGALSAADNAAKTTPAVRERDTARDGTSARNAPAAAAPELARSAASPAELQARARDPDAWIARIRKLRADGRVAEAVAELREFRRYVPDAETRLPTDLRQWVPNP